MNGYDAWKTTEPDDPFDAPPPDVEDDPFDSPLFEDHWENMTDEEAEARANAAMMGM